MKLRLAQRYAVVLITAALSSQLAGCGYPQVSPKAYEISKALYAVCNQKSTERLAVVSGLIDDSLADGSLTAGEGEWLHDIVAAGQNGNWESATREARRIMSDQVGR